MELYLFLALLFVYLLTSLMVKRDVVQRIWTLAFISSFVITAIAIASIRVSGQDVMMSASELNWYYLLYLFGSLSVVLGLINVWMYRKAVWGMFFPKSGNDEDDEDDE